MTDTPLTPAEEIDALAAEYVLGVLDLAERSAAEARIRTDATFAARVAAWERRLSPLNDGYAEAPAPDLLPRIEARLFPQAGRLRRGWFGWALAGAAAAAVAVALLLPLTQTTKATLVATLQTEDRSLVYAAVHDGTQLTVSRQAGTAAPAGQVHELWAIAPGAAPVSLGLLADAPLSIDYPVPPAGWTLAVSVEPAGGSPTGAPTGPVILAAEIGA